MHKLIGNPVLLGVALALCFAVQAQEYPSKLIKIVVPIGI